MKSVMLPSLRIGTPSPETINSEREKTSLSGRLPADLVVCLAPPGTVAQPFAAPLPALPIPWQGKALKAALALAVLAPAAIKSVALCDAVAVVVLKPPAAFFMGAVFTISPFTLAPGLRAWLDSSWSSRGHRPSLPALPASPALHPLSKRSPSRKAGRGPERSVHAPCAKG